METTLRRQIIATFGITFVLIVAMIVTWKLKFYDAVNALIKTTQDSYASNKTVADTLPTVLKQKAVAQENLVLAKGELKSLTSRFRALRFNMTPGPPLNTTWKGYMTEYGSGYGLAVRKQLMDAADDAGVTINTALKVDAPPQMPENVVAPTSGFLRPAGGALTITAVGALPNIMAFLERVNKTPILATVGAITLNGASPEITASFTVTPYLLAFGPSIPPEGGAPVAAAPVDAAAVPATATATADSER